MEPASLHDGITRAGSPVKLLWQANPVPWLPENTDPEYAGWRAEQASWHDGVSFSDLSHHRTDTVIEGTEAARLLADVSANDYADLAVGQATRFVPVTSAGHLVTDGILLRETPDRYVLSGVPAGHNWVTYHAVTGGYYVSFGTDPSAAVRGDKDPWMFRYQVQGPLASALVEKVLKGPPPSAEPFRSAPVTLGSRRLRVLRHSTAGSGGFEFTGEWSDAAPVRDALLEAGEEFGIVRVGAWAYASASVESGWIPAPVPGIYTDPDLADYRKWLPLSGVEGQRPLHGSFYSPDIEDYYVSPWELGYGRYLSFGHDFIGRDALQAAKETAPRTKVTLVLDPDDVREHDLARGGFYLTYARHRVETRDGTLIGLTHQTATIDPAGTILALSLIGKEHAEPGTQVTVVWGEHPGAGTDPGADLGFPRIRATVAPAPYEAYDRKLPPLSPLPPLSASELACR